MRTQMKNPYREPIVDSVPTFGRGLARVGIALFAALLVIPPLAGWWGGETGEPSVGLAGGTLTETLRNVEDRFEDGRIFESWRAAEQARLVRWFGEGSARVLIGRDGWLFYRPDVEAVVGKGPRYVEPPSVARAPNEREWNRPIPVIRDFAEQLRERGIELVLVPVPTKPMIESAELGVTRTGTKAIAPPEWDSVLEELGDVGATVIDLLPLFGTRSDEGRVFLRQDTHWTPETMEAAAALLGDRIRKFVPEASRGEFEIETVRRKHAGDLVGMLDLGESSSGLFRPETVPLRRVLAKDTGEPVASDPGAEIVLLGDSFVNVFEDPSLGFGEADEADISAGFSSHLSRELGRPLHVIAINGGGATGVRQSFASLPAETIAAKKLVVWVLSARDLFLAEIPGRRARIEWEEVSLPEAVAVPGQPEPGEMSDPVVITGRLRERSAVGDPTETPYASALYSTIFEDLEIVSGSFGGDEACVFLWAFRDRKPTPTAGLEPGRRYRLELVPLPTSGPEASATQLDDFFRTDLGRWFATSAEPVADP